MHQHKEVLVRVPEYLKWEHEVRVRSSTYFMLWASHPHTPIREMKFFQFLQYFNVKYLNLNVYLHYFFNVKDAMS